MWGTEPAVRSCGVCRSPPITVAVKRVRSCHSWFVAWKRQQGLSFSINSIALDDLLRAEPIVCRWLWGTECTNVSNPVNSGRHRLSSSYGFSSEIKANIEIPIDSIEENTNHVVRAWTIQLMQGLLPLVYYRSEGLHVPISAPQL